MKKLTVLLFINLCLVGTVRAIRNEYTDRIRMLSDEILITANDLKEATNEPIFDSLEIEEILTELKDLIQNYENIMVFARSPYPGEILLGTTPGGDSGWLETLCSNPHSRPVKEIQLKRTGRDASYLRINDIEITYLTPVGMKKEVFNKNGRFRLYYDGVYKLSLPGPMMITKIRILVEHKSSGLNVYGVY